MHAISSLGLVLAGLVFTSPCSADPAALLAPDDPSYASGWRPPSLPTAGLKPFRPAEPKDWLQLNKNVTPAKTTSTSMSDRGRHERHGAEASSKDRAEAEGRLDGRYGEDAMTDGMRRPTTMSFSGTSALIMAALLLLGGCANFTPDGGMSPVVAVAASRLNADVAKIESGDDAGTAQERAAALLNHPLTAGHAVQIAFLRNRDLQAAFNELGVSEAEYVKASLPPEPSFNLNQLAGMGDVEFVSQVAVGLFALATLPARQEIASEKFQAAQWRTAGEVMALAAAVSRQYYMAIAAQEQETFLSTAVGGAQASADLSRQLGEAGNINKLQQAREGSLYLELGAQLADARLQAKAERERLTRMMGLWGRDIAFRLPKVLPALPKAMISERNVEATALDQRLDLRAARQDLDALARQLGLTTATRYVTDVNLAFQNDTERSGDSGGSKVGTQNRSSLVRNGAVLDFTIPLYDFGESRVRNARETYMAAANRLAQRAINARSQAREAYTRYRGKYDLARYYQERVVPLQTTIFQQSSLETNGMLSDVSQLIIDARLRSTNNVAAIAAKRDYFIAAVDLKAALTGNGPGGSGDTPRMPTAGPAQAVN